ncbi:MAG: hypothetical protein Q8M40_11720 [Legionella sp.]|nr:hypothetical protein [Legionella sp.]
MYEKNEHTINWVGLLVKGLEENWQGFVKKKATVLYPPESELITDSDQLDWALKFSKAEDQSNNVKNHYLCDRDHLIEQMSDKLNIDGYLLATVDDLCALGRLAPQMIESIDQLMEIMREVNEYKRDELKKLAAYYPSLIVCFENNREVFLDLITQLMNTALEDTYVLRCMVFTPSISSKLTKDQSYQLQSHLFLYSQTREKFTNILKDERFAQFVKAQSDLPTYSRTELLSLLTYHPALLSFLYQENALRGSVFNEMTLYKYFNAVPDSVLDLIKDEVFIKDIQTLSEPASRLMTLIEINNKAIPLILENPDLAIHLRTLDIFKILKDFPSNQVFIYNSPILLDKIKFDFFALPDEIKLHVARHLHESDGNSLAKTSSFSLALFKPHSIVNQLLNHVACNNSVQVNRLLAKYSDLWSGRGTVKDCSERVFNNISAFEYAVWAKDSVMLAHMLNSIPPGERANVYPILWSQYEAVKASGVSYVFNGVTITESHINVENTLIDALSNFLFLYKNNMKSESAEYWVNSVGRSQKLMPLHIVDEYGLNSSNNNSNKQSTYLVSRRRSVWYSESSKLGIEQAIYVGQNGMAVLTTFPKNNEIINIERNLDKLKILWATRLSECELQIEKIKAELENNTNPKI